MNPFAVSFDRYNHGFGWRDVLLDLRYTHYCNDCKGGVVDWGEEQYFH